MMATLMRWAAAAAVLLALAGCSFFDNPTTRDRIEEQALEAADELMRGPVTDLIKAKAPMLMPVLDANEDGKVSLEEAREIDIEDPATLATLVLAVQTAL